MKQKTGIVSLSCALLFALVTACGSSAHTLENEVCSVCSSEVVTY